MPPTYEAVERNQRTLDIAAVLAALEQALSLIESALIQIESLVIPAI